MNMKNVPGAHAGVFCDVENAVAGIVCAGARGPDPGEALTKTD